MIYVGIVGILVLYLDIAPGTSVWFAVTGDPSVLSILGAHVLLNLKIEGERTLQQGASHPTKSTFLGIEFVAPSADDVDSTLNEATTDVGRSGTAEREEIAA